MSEQAARASLRFVAYADETRFNVGRYRGIALISLQECHTEAFKTEIQRLLVESEVSELKWQKVNSAKDRFAALKVLSLVVDKACRGQMRADVLVWDCHDKRHVVNRRDDIANLQRMYYHLLKNVLRERWPDGGIWNIFPDEHTSLDWEAVENHLIRVSMEFEGKQELLTGWRTFVLRLRTEFKVEAISPSQSHREPLVQTADVFAGLAAFSCEKFNAYEHWLKDTTAQQRLFAVPVDAPPKISGADRERFRVLAEFDRICKERKLGVSLRTNRGLRTLNPGNPINFWLYVPQHDKDKAPVKGV